MSLLPDISLSSLLKSPKKASAPKGIWPKQLFPASFRGVAFQVRGHSRAGGRRVAEFEFALRDDGFVEDMGRKLRTYHVTAFIIGDDYLYDAQNLEYALEGFNVPGQLIHPWLGRLSVVCTHFSRQESVADGNMVIFDLSFVEAGGQPLPTAARHTQSRVLAAAADNRSALKVAFDAIHNLAGLPALVAQYSHDLMSSLGGDLADMVGASDVSASDLSDALGTLKNLPVLALMSGKGLASILTSPIDLFCTTAGGMIGAGQYLGSVKLSSFLPSSVDIFFSGSASGASYAVSSRGDSNSRSDPSWGLSALAGWTPSVAAVGVGSTAQIAMATNAQAITNLVQGSAVTAMAQIYAITDWPNSGVALAARDQLLSMMDTQIVAADLLNQAQSVMAWQALKTAAYQDLTTRAAQAPSLTAYQVAGALPSLVLAHKLYQDATRADELVGMTGAIHPGFMPKTGTVLAS